MISKINRSKLHGRLVYITHLIPINDYDRLYENINNLEHFRWKEFIQNENIKVEYIQNFAVVRHTDPGTGYWFFKDRNDRRAVEFQICDTTYQYSPNAMLYTAQRFKIKHKSLENKFPDRPAIKLNFL